MREVFCSLWSLGVKRRATSEQLERVLLTWIAGRYEARSEIGRIVMLWREVRPCSVRESYAHCHSVRATVQSIYASG